MGFNSGFKGLKQGRYAVPSVTDASSYLKWPHMFFMTNALATKRFKHHFIKPGDSEDISVSQILHFVQGAGMLN